MYQFARLYEQLDQTHSTNEKIELMARYFRQAPSQDAAWALFFLSGRRLKRFISAANLRAWSLDFLQIPEWLFDESYAAVGDTGETIALLIPRKNQISDPISLAEWLEKRILPLKDKSLHEKKENVCAWWKEFSGKDEVTECFLLNKILTGGFRVGVSELLTLRALEEAIRVERVKLTEKLLGNWQPSSEFFESLKKDIESSEKTILQPFPFFLATAVLNLEELGDPHEWLAEWKWDGIRAQLIFRNSKAALWSRGMELVNEQFPELIEAAAFLTNSCVLDGEIVAYKSNKPLNFNHLQRRIGRKKLSKELMKEVPTVFMAYDLLELKGEDLRKKPLMHRRDLLKKMLEETHHSSLLFSIEVEFSHWSKLQKLRDDSRKMAAEGFVIKKRDSIYEVGRKKGNWWKYKIDPMTLDAVLMYAQPGSGIRANLYTDYTFGIWKNDELVPIAKAYSGLNREEILELDKWIRRNTEEKFGPVRKVKVEQVFELAFEGIQSSTRHKSKIAVRFPRILRWRKDKLASEANTIEDALKLIEL